jgi:hypothetical protein
MMNLKQKFKSAIKRGTGEAHILIKENPTVDFSKEIIKAALFNFAYDQQSEGGRDFYIAELIELSLQKDKILPLIYKALSNEITDDWSIEQLFDIAAIFSKKGDERAKKAIYKNYYKHAMNDSDWVGRDAVIEAEGIEGLLFVAETTGKMLTKYEDKWEDSFLVDDFQKENPSIDVYGKLRKASENNSYVKKYVETIEKNKFTVYKPNKDKQEKYDYQYVKDRFKNKYLGIGPRVFEKLSKKNLKKLADDFLKETKRSKQEKYLRIFAHVKFPYDYQPILELAKTKSSKKDRLVEFAVEALQFFKAKDIRQFAVEKLSATAEPEIYTNLLIGNYEKGDWKLLKSIAEKYKNDDIIHSLGSSYIGIYEANPTKECKEPLEVIYDKMNCGLHRKHLIKNLIENDVLCDKIRNEIQFDCSEETRKLFG